MMAGVLKEDEGEILLFFYNQILIHLHKIPSSLDIGVYLRYIKCINNVNTLLTYLVQYMLRFPEVFEDLAA